jgi:hypothetical protein
MLRLPDALEEQLWSEIQTFETVEHMPYVTSAAGCARVACAPQRT